MSKQGESPSGVHDGSIAQGCQRASESVLVDEVLSSPKSISMVYFPSDGAIPSSSGTEPPEKRHCRRGVQFDERKVTARPTGEESSIFCQAESAVLPGCDFRGLELINSADTPLLAEDIASMSDSGFLELLTKSDPSSLHMPAFLEAYPPANEDIDSDYSKNEIRVSDADICSAKMYDDVIVAAPMVSETQVAPTPIMEVSNFLSERAPFIFHQGESAVPLDGGLPALELLDSDHRGILTGGDLVGNTLTETNASRIPDSFMWPDGYLTTDPDNAGVSAASSNNSVEMPHYSAALLAGNNDDNLVIQFLASETQGAPSSIESELEANVTPMRESNVMQRAPAPVIPYGSLVSSSEAASASCSETNGQAQGPITRLDAQSSSTADENAVDPRIGEQHQPLPTRRLLIEKELTETDVGITVAGIKLPKESVTKYFDAIPENSQGQMVTFHDAVTEHKTWIMRITTGLMLTSASSDALTRVYTLKDTWDYLKHHSLDAGDWIRIFRDEPGDRYIVNFERGSAQHNPPSHQRHLFGKSWKLIIRKILTRKYSNEGLKSFGALLLNKKKVEKHFPPVKSKRGVEINFYDWDTERTWQMAVKYGTTWKRGRVYRLDGMTAFCRFYHLQTYDFVEIFKSDDLDASYALRACKSADRADRV